MIKRLLEKNVVVFVGRNGSIEMNAMINQVVSADVMERHTGIWTDLQEWRSAYLNANRGCDVIAAGWYTQNIRFAFGPNRSLGTQKPVSVKTFGL